MKFKAGDTVVLKSGGPTMTIVNPVYKYDDFLTESGKTHTGYYNTTWFAGKKQEKSSFHEDTIDLAK